MTSKFLNVGLKNRTFAPAQKSKILIAVVDLSHGGPSHGPFELINPEDFSF